MTIAKAAIHLASFALCLHLMSSAGQAQQPWVVYDGYEGPGQGKHIVLISGDEEYRSEEMMPQLGKILAVHHGFKCTVLFAIDPNTGLITPTNVTHLPGLEALASADLMILFTRFRELPDHQMRHLDAYIQSGKPIFGIRTATHAFRNRSGPYTKWQFRSEVAGFEGGFGRVVLGETWISHHGHHGQESTRGLIAPEARSHPVTRGIRDGDIWGPTDVYTVRLPLLPGCEPLVLGQVLKGMAPGDAPVVGEKNDPMMPIAWTRDFHTASGKKARVFTSTYGCSKDFSSAGGRRLFVNAAYWCLQLEAAIPVDGTKVDLVGPYEPTPFGFGKFKPGMRPEDHRIME
jgi:type 1 glutamine amidotransferase